MTRMTKMSQEQTALLDVYGAAHMNVFGRPQRVLERGRGMYVYDTDGAAYLDFLAGIAVNALGYAHPAWIEAVASQAGLVAHTSNYFATQPQIELLQKLLEIAQAPEGSRVYFANSGAEANEAALKLATLHARARHPKQPARIVALSHGFHGRTMGALSATWKPAIREPYQPLVPTLEFIEPTLEAITSTFGTAGEDDGHGATPVDAVIIELIQGEAGVLPLGASFVKALRAACDEAGALLIIDEVQTGAGRTGSWFAYQNPELAGGVMPDAVSFAKGMAGGFPMGGLITFGPETSSLFTPGSHGSTFAGGPLACAAALATIKTIEAQSLLKNAGKQGAYIKACLQDLKSPLIKDMRGAGLLLAIQLTAPVASAVATELLARGVIVNAVAPDAIRLAPPLIVSAQDIDAFTATWDALPSAQLLGASA